MNLFNPFDAATTQTLTDSHAIVADIYADCQPDLSRVSFNVGHAAAYGRPIAYAARRSSTIAWVLDNDHSQLFETKNGYRAKDMREFKGTAIHELGHVVQFQSAVKPWKDANLIACAKGVHGGVDWIWVCMRAWQELGGAAGKTVSERTLRVAAKLAPDALHGCLQSFSPYRVPAIATRKGALKLLAARKVEDTHTCGCCGKAFKQAHTGRKAKFCSNACKAADYRKRKAAKEAAEQTKQAA